MSRRRPDRFAPRYITHGPQRGVPLKKRKVAPLRLVDCYSMRCMGKRGGPPYVNVIELVCGHVIRRPAHRGVPNFCHCTECLKPKRRPRS